MVKVWRRLLVSLQPELVTTSRVRMRRLVCAYCGRRVWVMVGPPRCESCTKRRVPVGCADDERSADGTRSCTTTAPTVPITVTRSLS